MAEQIYDPEMEEVKELVKRQSAQIEDIHKTLHSMRNAQRRHFVYRLLWWVVVTGVGAWAYYTFAWPYIEQIMQAYGSAQDLQVQVQNFFAQFGHQTAQ
jgi:hypothetical protein